VDLERKMNNFRIPAPRKESISTWHRLLKLSITPKVIRQLGGDSGKLTGQKVGRR